jgi:hypothetical protein
MPNPRDTTFRDEAALPRGGLARRRRHRGRVVIGLGSAMRRRRAAPRPAARYCTGPFSAGGSGSA